MIAGPLRYPVDRARVRVVHPRIDLEPVTLASAIFPRGRAQIAQRYLALAAIELRDLPEFRGVAFAGAAGETVEDASADVVDRVGATRLHQPEFVKRLMREKRSACRGFRPAARRTRNESQRGECRQQQRSGIARRIPEQAGHVFSFIRDSHIIHRRIASQLGLLHEKVQIVSRCHVFRHLATDPPSLACEGAMRETKRPERTLSGAGQSNGDETWRVRSSRNLRHRAWSCMSPQARWRITSVSCGPATCCSCPVRFASMPKAS